MRIIISPSGKLYGSENVLFDYLKYTTLNFKTIYVPNASPFKAKLEKNNFKTNGFNNIKWLYLRILCKLLTSKINSVYINEAGHIRYVYLLALICPWVKFIVHVRILEDTPRIKKARKNLKFICISKTIQLGILVSNEQIYDGYNFSELKNWRISQSPKLRVGIVGRITATKGLDVFTNSFFQNCRTSIQFIFFGDIDIDFNKTNLMRELQNQKRVIFIGFIDEKNDIYSSVDVILHVNEFEGLGRIFFESLDFGIPFIGINKGGIAEISEQINYPYIFEKKELAQVLKGLAEKEWFFDIRRIDEARNNALSIFSLKNYTDRLDRILD